MILETNLEDVHPLGVKPAGKNPGKHGKETPVSADGQPMYGQPTFEQALGKYLEEVAKRLVPYVTGSEKPNLPFRLDRAVQKAADVRYAFVSEDGTVAYEVVKGDMFDSINALLLYVHADKMEKDGYTALLKQVCEELRVLKDGPESGYFRPEEVPEGRFDGLAAKLGYARDSAPGSDQDHSYKPYGKVTEQGKLEGLLDN